MSHLQGRSLRANDADEAAPTEPSVFVLSEIVESQKRQLNETCDMLGDLITKIHEAGVDNLLLTPALRGWHEAHVQVAKAKAAAKKKTNAEIREAVLARLSPEERAALESRD